MCFSYTKSRNGLEKDVNVSMTSPFSGRTDEWEVCKTANRANLEFQYIKRIVKNIVQSIFLC